MEKPEMLQEMLEKVVATEHDTNLTGKARKMLSFTREIGYVGSTRQYTIPSLGQASVAWAAQSDS